MQVLFANTSTTQRKYVLDIGIRHITFVDGRYSTTDKDVIKRIMTRPDFRSRQIILVSDAKAVADYLAGTEPDYLDMEAVESISDEGVVKLANYFDLPQKEASIARYAMINLPVDDYVSDVINLYPKTEQKEDYLTLALGEGLIEKNGAWYMLKNGSGLKFHGPRAASAWMNDHYKELKLQGVS